MARGRAEASFYFQWSDPVDLTDDYLLVHAFEPSKEEREYAIDRVSLWCMEAPWEITRQVEAETFEELMERIDEVETDLMFLERRQADSVNAFLGEIVQTIKDNRLKT